MEPYYSDDLVTLYQGDALEVLPTLPDACASAVVTDPPYVIGAVSAGSLSSKSGTWADMMNSSHWFAAWYAQAARVTRHNGAIWTFCNWRTLPVVMKAAVDVRLPVTSLAVWDKECIGPGGKQGLRPSHELIALLAKPDFSIPDRSVPDVWRHKTSGHKQHGHPAEKPEALLLRVLQTHAMPPGSLVIDPFAGSGTTAAAAKSLGLRCIAIEADPQYCDLIARRLSQTQFGIAEATPAPTAEPPSLLDLEATP